MTMQAAPIVVKQQRMKGTQDVIRYPSSLMVSASQQKAALPRWLIIRTAEG